nr:hypothetical protein [Streptomyces antimycoticus]WTB09475.1 hypothetical protein OG546_38110 [Streptomyces antimycoticus]
MSAPEHLVRLLPVQDGDGPQQDRPVALRYDFDDVAFLELGRAPDLDRQGQLAVAADMGGLRAIHGASLS